LPFIVTFSGGKDSSCVLQLVWMAMRRLPPDQRKKPIYVISTNTLVENPIVVQWTDGSLAAMRDMAGKEGLPIEPHRLTPDLDDSFWVCLIGKGYASPRPQFRWCTERLKIRPSNAFIERITTEGNGSMLLLGTRKAESGERARRMSRLEAQRVRDRVSPNVALPGSFVYSPIEDWTNDDVWLFLMQCPNPWGWSNKGLMSMYRSASEDNECPVVLDTSTPSCGNSRFGCWTCTMVEQDKSLTAMASNEVEFEWMLPLVALRNELDIENDRYLRDFRRMSGRVEFMRDGTTVIPGPYHRAGREHWLRRVLETQRIVREMAPPSMKGLELVGLEELRRIRRTWVHEKYEIEDSLPSIYLSATGQIFPDDPIELPSIDLAHLRATCPNDHAYELCRSIVATMHFGVGTPELPTKVSALFDRFTFETEAQALATAQHDQLRLFKKTEHPPVDAAALRTERITMATKVLRDVGVLAEADMLPGADLVPKENNGGGKRGKRAKLKAEKSPVKRRAR
jgi:DNA sulfur modification protein DndC